MYIFCSHVLEHYICCRFRTFPRSYACMDHKQAGTYIYSPPMLLQFCPQKLTPILDRPDITAQFLIPVNLVLLKITIIRNNCRPKQNTQFDLFILCFKRTRENQEFGSEGVLKGFRFRIVSTFRSLFICHSTQLRGT